jgi:hypothetical protein
VAFGSVANSAGSVGLHSTHRARLDSYGVTNARLIILTRYSVKAPCSVKISMWKHHGF